MIKKIAVVSLNIIALLYLIAYFGVYDTGNSYCISQLRKGRDYCKEIPEEDCDTTQIPVISYNYTCQWTGEECTVKFGCM